MKEPSKPSTKAAQAKNNRTCPVALLLIDVMNHFDYPGWETLVSRAIHVLPRLVSLKEYASDSNIPVIYVNDHFGEWRSTFADLVWYCRRPGARGAKVAESLVPSREDYTVLKPMHSAFFQTPLELLLQSLGVQVLILAGLTTDSCVFCTAYDAHMRGYQVFVPSDCSTALSEARHRNAIRHLKGMRDTDTTISSSKIFRARIQRLLTKRLDL